MNAFTLTRLAAPVLVAALVAAAGDGVGAQERTVTGPLSNMILTGFGSALYDASLGQQLTNTPNDFSASISPVLLFGMGEDMLFEAELEFGVSGPVTTTTLEYAQIDYLGFENVQLVAGKFLLPFGIFGERLHPSWINRLPTMPLLFGHAHGGVAEDALLPILSDAGVMGRLTQPVGAGSLNLSVYVTQGPMEITEDAVPPDGHAHSILEAGDDGRSAAGGAAAYDVPDVGFGVAFADNNANKMLGARLGYVRAPGVELYLSGFHAMYDSDNYLDYQGLALSAQMRHGAYGLLAEAAYLRQEFAVGATTFETMERPGYYVELTRAIGTFEPVVRWSRLLDADVNGSVVRPGSEELTLGLNYRFVATAPVKVAYVLDPDFADRVLVQWAFGF